MNFLFLGRSEAAGLVSEVLHKNGIPAVIAATDNVGQFWQELNKAPDLILLDFAAADDAAQMLPIIGNSRVIVPVIVIADGAAEHAAQEAVDRGADDYLLTAGLGRLPFAIRNSLDKFQLKAERAQLLEEKTRSEQKMLQAARLYTFLSRINHAIISIQDQETLFRETCRIAAGVGGFVMAWIGTIDPVQQRLNIVAGCGVPEKDLHLFKDVQYDEQWPQHLIAKTGSYYVCNDVDAIFSIKPWKALAAEKNLGSFIVLPIRQGGTIIATFSLYSTEPNFFSEAETGLLEKVAGELSFKLDIFEKDRLKAIADQRLAESERKLKQAHACAHLGGWELDFATGIAEWSEEALRIYGLPVTDTKQSIESWSSFIHPDDADEVFRTIEAARENMQSFRLRHRIVRRDGSIRYLQSDTFFSFDADGTPTGMHGAALDITEMVQAQEALQESESRYSTLFHMSPVPGWLYDVDTYRIVQVNKAAVEHYGYTEEEFLNMTIWDIRPEEDFPEVLASIDENKGRDHTIHTHKFRHYKKSGELIDVDIYSSAIVFKEKTYRLILAIDVTERNNYENRMTAAIIQTQENERNEIGAELHDNVCQILASTLLKLSLLESSLQHDAVKPFKQIRSSITLATKEIRNLSHRLAPASFNESTLKESIRLLLRTYSMNKKYQVGLHYDERIDALPLSRGVRLNLYRIIQEQLSNIIKHSGAAEILIELGLEGEHLKLTISDDGKGCDLAEAKGGIGLANMKRRAQLFAGSFDAVSAPGAGYRILVEIPVQENLLRQADAQPLHVARARVS